MNRKFFFLKMYNRIMYKLLAELLIILLPRFGIIHLSRLRAIVT